MNRAQKLLTTGETAGLFRKIGVGGKQPFQFGKPHIKHIAFATALAAGTAYFSASAHSKTCAEDATQPHCPSVAVPPPQFEHESDKGKFVLAAFQYNKFDQIYTHSDLNFCRGFIADFQKQANLEHREPQAKSAQYDQTPFTPYLGKCGGTDWHRAEGAAGGGPNATAFFYGFENLKLYSPKGLSPAPHPGTPVVYMEGLIALGADTPLSTEEAIAHRQETKTLVSEGLTTFHRKSGGYFSLDKETCRLRRLVSITDHAFWNARLPTIAERAVAGVNGLITYQGKNYIYDFQYAPLTGDKSDNDLTLYELTSEGSSEVCKFYQNEGTQGE